MVHKLRSSAPAIRVDSDQMTSRPDLFTLTVQKECRNHRLTRREEEVISHAFSGKTDKEIARALGNSPRTVQQQLQNVYRKLGVRTRMEAVRRLLRSHDDIFSDKRDHLYQTVRF